MLAQDHDENQEKSIDTLGEDEQLGTMDRKALGKLSNVADTFGGVTEKTAVTQAMVMSAALERVLAQAKVAAMVVTDATAIMWSKGEQNTFG